MSEPAGSIPTIESPCIGTCTLGPAGLCVGCFRSAAEIAAWLAYSDDERSVIMRELPERARRLFDEA